MDRLYNFFCFPLLLLGLIFISNGFVGFVENNTVDIKNNTKMEFPQEGKFVKQGSGVSENQKLEISFHPGMDRKGQLEWCTILKICLFHPMELFPI